LELRTPRAPRQIPRLPSGRTVAPWPATSGEADLGVAVMKRIPRGSVHDPDRSPSGAVFGNPCWHAGMASASQFVKQRGAGEAMMATTRRTSGERAAISDQQAQGGTERPVE